MKSYQRITIISALLCGLGLVTSVSADESCTNVSGKIFNNAIATGNTLGTVHFKFGSEKFKCGLLGVKKEGGDQGQILFDHTIVCDDDVGSSGAPVHSQLVLNTAGTKTGEYETCWFGTPSFSFDETSTPIYGTGRFAGVDPNTSWINVQGNFYCTLAIDMDFEGKLCFYGL